MIRNNYGQCKSRISWSLVSNYELSASCWKYSDKVK
jgi:hypothetical protein